MPAMRLVAPSSDAVSRIRRLGLTDADVEYVGLAMLEGAAAAHPLGVKAEAGSRRWFAGVSALGDRKVPEGWSREGDLEGITNPDRTLAIVVTQGDSGVGILTQDVRARRRRGTITVARVQSNGVQLGFDGFELPVQSDRPPVLWMLLHFTGQGILRLELSLPRSIADNGRVIDWAERIPLGSFGYGDSDDTLTFLDGVTPPPGLAPIRLVPKA